METKIKKLELKQAGEHKIVEVTLEKGGKEYIFTAKAIHVLDEGKFKGLLQIWDEQMIPEQEAEGSLTDEMIERKLVGIAKPKVKK